MPNTRNFLIWALEPTIFPKSLLDSIMNIAIQYRDNIDRSLIMPNVSWQNGRGNDKVTIEAGKGTA